MNRFFSKNYVYREQFFLVDYGEYKEYVLLKNSRLPGFEEIGEKYISKSASKEEIKRIETSRIKHRITEYSLCNDFEFFFTQTLNSNYNRYDLEEFKQNIQKKFKAYKRKNKNFIYLVIFEKHKDGAYHLHGLVGGVGMDLYKNKNGYFSLAFFEDLGFNSISEIKDKIKVSYYITKYITKEMQKTASGYSYFHCQGLKLPRRVVLDFREYKDNLEMTFENDFCKKYTISANNLLHKISPL